MISALIVIFILGMATIFYAENKDEIDNKSDKFKDNLED